MIKIIIAKLRKVCLLFEAFKVWFVDFKSVPLPFVFAISGEVDATSIFPWSRRNSKIYSPSIFRRQLAADGSSKLPLNNSVFKTLSQHSQSAIRPLQTTFLLRPARLFIALLGQQKTQPNSVLVHSPGSLCNRRRRRRVTCRTPCTAIER